MDIREILESGPNLTSIKKIDKYLASISPNHRDYPRALAHLAYLTYQIGNVSEAFSLLYGYLEKCPFKEKTVIYDTLISIYYLANDYNHVKEMIEAKKPFLPSYHKSGYYEDLIKYYYKLDDETELIRTLLIYLGDDISDERRLKALILLNKLYKKHDDISHFKEKNELMKNIALALKETETYNESLYNEAYIAYKEANYEEALQKCNELLEINLSTTLKASLLALKLSTLIYLGDYRKASIFEAEYDKDILLGDKETKLFFITECMRLYDAMGNKFNYNIYANMLSDVGNEEKKVIEEKPVSKKKAPKKLDFTFLEANGVTNNQEILDYDTPHKSEQVVEEIVIKHKKIIREDGNSIIVGEMLSDLNHLFDKINKMTFPSSREYIRFFLSQLAKTAFFDEAYILLKQKEFKGYHYKKERLYDKVGMTIDNSFLKETFSRNEERIILDSSELTNCEINSGKPYNELAKCSLLAFPIMNGVILYTAVSEDMITKGVNYEKLKFAASFLEQNLLFEENKLNLAQKYNDYTFMLDHFTAGYKRQQDNIVYLSQEAMRIFGLKETTEIEELYAKINPLDRSSYRKQIIYLLDNKCDGVSIRYSIGEKYYQESFKSDGLGHILSLIEDLTSLKKEEEASYLMATSDPLSKGYNKAKFYFDLDDYLKSEKCTLFILEMKNFNLYNELYGADFGNQLIYAMSKFLCEIPNIKVYHFERDRFVLALVGEVDKRSMYKKALLIAETLKDKLYKLNERVNSYYVIGYLRLKTDINEHDKDKIMAYLTGTLKYDTKLNLEHTINLFNFNDYKREIYEAQLITHLSESIDQNHLRITYRQVVDLERGNCDHYIAGLNLTNFATSEEELFYIINKRHKTIEMERYIIHKVLFEIKEIYKQTHLYINVGINVSYETLTQGNFKDYLLEQIKFFGISKSAITINYNGLLNKYSLQILKELKLNEIMLSSNNLNLLKEMPLTYFYYEIGGKVIDRELAFIFMVNDYCRQNSVSLAIDGVNNQAVVSRFSGEGIRLYAGKLYNAKVSKDDILKAFLV